MENISKITVSGNACRISSLRARKAALLEEMKSLGHEAGKDWADEAFYDDLVIIANFLDEADCDWDAFKKYVLSDADLAAILGGVDEDMQIEHHPRLCTNDGDLTDEGESWLEGFADGFQESWNQVKTELA